MLECNSNMMEIKKGPWKGEEDEVLKRHVNKYGPKDWSSIRAKGLLQRTGKSCRLRWVNKLRPNLKIGMKFSAEEERVVIELQGEFGNRWAKIATHLPGRTDNDVKNFWSSRQKRLARLLQNPPSSSSSPQPKPTHQYRTRIRSRNQLSLLPHDDGSTHSKVRKLCFSAEEESSSSLTENSHLIQLLPLPDCVLNSKPISCEQNLNQVKSEPFDNDFEPVLHPFPPIPDLLSEFQPKEEYEIIPNFFDVIGNVESSGYGGGDDLAQFSYLPSCFGGEGHTRIKTESPDIIFDELPLDMFDQIEPLRSPRRSGNI